LIRGKHSGVYGHRRPVSIDTVGFEASLQQSEPEPLSNLFLEESILELLFAHHLSALLTSSHEVGHDLLGGPERLVLKDFKTFVGQLPC